jgi:AcrR family transcriptional regulator
VSSSEPAESGAAPSARYRRMERGRRELALTAMRQYAEKGFAQTTVEEIAQAADYAPSTFFRHFGSKENSVFFDIDERMELYRQLQENPPPRGEGWARLREAFLENARRWCDRDPEFARARTGLMLNEPAIHARFLDYCAQSEEIVSRILAHDLQRDCDDDVYCGVVATAAIGVWRTALRVWLRNGGSLVEHMRTGLDLIETGLPSTARKPRRGRSAD